MKKSYIWKCEWCIISKPQNPQIVILHKKYNIFGVVFLHVNRTHHYLYLGFFYIFRDIFFTILKKTTFRSGYKNPHSLKGWSNRQCEFKDCTCISLHYFCSDKIISNMLFSSTTSRCECLNPHQSQQWWLARVRRTSSLSPLGGQAKSM
jgi:hypothetical protein